MTAQEQQMIQSLAERVNNTPLSEKDPDAEQLLQQALGRNHDALYILAQTVLVQQYALEQAQKQLADVRSQLDQSRQQAQQAPQPRHATSFLGNLLGLGEEPARPAPPPTPVTQRSPPAYAPGYAPVQERGSAGYAAPGSGYGVPQPTYGQPQPAYGQPQAGGFLRSAMQTATGVAAGALAFQGIESLMHGFGGSGSSSGFGMGSGVGGSRPEEIVNNYYGDSAAGDHGGHFTSESEDRRGDSSGVHDAVYHDQDDSRDSSTDDTASDDTDADSVDDTSDNSSFDDDTSSDDSGSDNSGDTNF